MYVHTPFLFQLIMLVFHSSPILPFPLESIYLISLSFFVCTAYECVQNMNFECVWKKCICERVHVCTCSVQYVNFV